MQIPRRLIYPYLAFLGDLRNPIPKNVSKYQINLAFNHGPVKCLKTNVGFSGIIWTD